MNTPSSQDLSLSLYQASLVQGAFPSEGQGCQREVKHYSAMHGRWTGDFRGGLVLSLDLLHECISRKERHPRPKLEMHQVPTESRYESRILYFDREEREREGSAVIKRYVWLRGGGKAGCLIA